MKAQFLRSILPSVIVAGFTLAMVNTCAADQPAPAFPSPQTGTSGTASPHPAPTSYVWDGHEYVGMSGGKYYYLGPNDEWQQMSSSRVHRFQAWEKQNPNWKNHAVRNTRYLGHDQGQEAQPMRGSGNNSALYTPPNTANPPTPRPEAGQYGPGQ